MMWPLWLLTLIFSSHLTVFWNCSHLLHTMMKQVSTMSNNNKQRRHQGNTVYKVEGNEQREGNQDTLVKTKKGGSSGSVNGDGNAVVYPVEPVVVQVIPHVKRTMNHTYRDFSQVPATAGYTAETDINKMSFAEKVRHMLEEPSFHSCISWMPHGRSFKVHKPLVFEKKVSPRYFGHSRYSSFLRQLNNHGFKHISKGVDRNCKSHSLLCLV